MHGPETASTASAHEAHLAWSVHWQSNADLDTKCSSIRETLVNETDNPPRAYNTVELSTNFKAARYIVCQEGSCAIEEVKQEGVTAGPRVRL